MRKFRFIGRTKTNYAPLDGKPYDETFSNWGSKECNVGYFSAKYPEDWQEVFEEPTKQLHKDTDLGYFAGLAMQVMLANTNSHEKENGCKNSIEWAKELIKQLDEQSK